MARRDPRYDREWGWTVGEKHAVVFMGFDAEGVRIADPSIGFEHWSRENLRDLWTGVIVRLTPRPSARSGFSVSSSQLPVPRFNR